MAKSTALVPWDKELAELAKQSANVVAGLGGGQFFSIRGGTLKLGDSAIPNSEMAVIVLAHTLENVFYGADFDPDNLTSPKCYAFGLDAATLAPYEAAPEKVSPLCKGCPNNEFGSAAKGRSKACRNRIRLACIPAGNFVQGRFEAVEDADTVRSAQVAYFSVPPTSINGWGAYVKGITTTLKRPPFAVFTRIKVTPDTKTQIVVTFELLGPAPSEFAEVLMKRSAEAADAIVFPYPERDEKPKASGKKRKF